MTSLGVVVQSLSDRCKVDLEGLCDTLCPVVGGGYSDLVWTGVCRGRSSRTPENFGNFEKNGHMTHDIFVEKWDPWLRISHEKLTHWSGMSLYACHT